MISENIISNLAVIESHPSKQTRDESHTAADVDDPAADIYSFTNTSLHNNYRL